MPPDTVPEAAKAGESDGLSREELLSFESDLPTLPSTMGKLLRVIEDPNSNLDEITVLVSGDASLSTQLLRVANSALFSQGGEIVHLADRIAMASGHGTPDGHPVENTAILESGCAVGLFETENPRELREFLSKMEPKWSAARDDLELNDLRSGLPLP